MHRTTSRRSKKSKGSTIVELSFVFIVFFAILIGIFDFGQFLFVHQALVERTRWAARAGVAGDYTGDQIKNLVVYGQTSAGTNGYFGLTTSMVTVNSYDANTDMWRTEIKVSGYPYKMFSLYVGGSYTGPTITIDIPRGLYN